MPEGQGREGSHKGFRTDTMCHTNSTPTPISDSEWMFKKKTKSNRAGTEWCHPISDRQRFPNPRVEFRSSSLKAISRPVHQEHV